MPSENSFAVSSDDAATTFKNTHYVNSLPKIDAMPTIINRHPSTINSIVLLYSRKKLAMLRYVMQKRTFNNITYASSYDRLVCPHQHRVRNSANLCTSSCHLVTMPSNQVCTSASDRQRGANNSTQREPSAERATHKSLGDIGTIHNRTFRVRGRHIYSRRSFPTCSELRNTIRYEKTHRK